MLVSQHRKTLTIEELSDSEMLLNRESNPGLPRLVNGEVTTVMMLVMCDEADDWVAETYAEIIATRPLGMWCTAVHQWMTNLQSQKI